MRINTLQILVFSNLNIRILALVFIRVNAMHSNENRFFFFFRKVVELLGSGVERGIRIFIKKLFLNLVIEFPYMP